MIWHDRIIYDLHNNHQTLSVNLSDTLLINHTNRKQDVCLWLKKKNRNLDINQLGDFPVASVIPKDETHETIHHLKYMDSNYNRAHWAHGEVPAVELDQPSWPRNVWKLYPHDS